MGKDRVEAKETTQSKAYGMLLGHALEGRTLDKGSNMLLIHHRSHHPSCSYILEFRCVSGDIPTYQSAENNNGPLNYSKFILDFWG